jgi:hypothetical protein
MEMEREPDPAGVSSESGEVTPRTDTRETRSLYRHPLAAVGGALVVAGLLAFVVLVIIDIFAAGENPYRSLVTFIGTPAVVLVGLIIFLIAVRIQVVRARKRGEDVRFMLRVEPSDPRYMRNLWLFLGLSALFVTIAAFSGFKAYEATDSVAFCGSACHEVMGPQDVTYLAGPHARVPCVDCHIGPGGSFWVKSKIDGIRQVVAVTTNNFDRPIATPVESLRPAQETCEGCHWPEQFLGQKLLTKSYFRTDEANSPWTISMLLNIGGGNPRTGRLEGIHWHMLSAQQVEYIATDERRQDIAWVRVTDASGREVAVYTHPEAEPIDPESEDLEVRVFDCMDCHNRPSHDFLPPATAMNLEMSKGSISSDLPYIRKLGLELLNAPHETTSDGIAAITRGVQDFYLRNYNGRYEELRTDIERAIEVLRDIYTANFFPEMRTDYRARDNDLSHFVNEGCFRCHFSDLETDNGEKISSDCDSCHTIVAQGPSANVADLPSDINGLTFEHPVEIGDVWQTIRCTQCHTPASGY